MTSSDITAAGFGLRFVAPVALGVSLGLVAGPVHGQTQIVEESPAPLLFGTNRTTLGPADVVRFADDPTPFGVRLDTLVVVDEKTFGAGVVPRGGASGVVTAKAAPIARTDDFAAVLRPFVGRPMSFQLLGEIQTAVVEYYREQARPLVAVTVPPQEISDGGLQINVLGFVLGEKRVEGNTRDSDTRLAGTLRVQPGEEIDSDQLVQDLDWLALNPFRRVQGVFEPGAQFGTTDIILQVEEVPRWSAYVGTSDAGGRGTGRARLFAGFNTDALSFPDHQLAYQITLSPDTLAEGALFGVPEREGYLSHALTYFAPLTLGDVRSKLTVQAYFVGSFDDIDDFISARTEATNLNAELAFPLREWTVGSFRMTPEVYGKLESKNQREETLFAGARVFDIRTRIDQAYLGFRGSYAGPLFERETRGTLDAYLAFGTSDVTGQDSESHALLNVSLDQITELESERSLKLKARAQFSADDLPISEYLGIGGSASVRGYETNELSSHAGITASAQFQGAQIQIPGRLELGILPYGFLDLGYAAETPTTRAMTLSSVGLGAQATIGQGAVGVVELGLPLADGVSTDKGDARIHFSLVARF